MPRLFAVSASRQPCSSRERTIASRSRAARAVGPAEPCTNIASPRSRGPTLTGLRPPPSSPRAGAEVGGGGRQVGGGPREVEPELPRLLVGVEDLPLGVEDEDRLAEGVEQGLGERREHRGERRRVIGGHGPGDTVWPGI